MWKGGLKHNSREGPNKIKESEAKTPQLCCNSNELHPSSYKEYSVKARYRKSSAEAIKQIYQSRISQEKVTSTKVTPKAPESAPPAPQQLYDEKEINEGFSRLTEVLSKIESELKIISFLELSTYFEKLFAQISIQNDISKKHLVFMDGITKIPKIVIPENQENYN